MKLNLLEAKNMMENENLENSNNIKEIRQDTSPIKQKRGCCYIITLREQIRVFGN